jgi:hypothetical protein
VTSLLAALGLAAPPAAAAVAVLPADAPGTLPGAKEALDASIAAKISAAGFDTLPQDRTARFIKSAVDAGLDCSLNEDDCALRAAVAAGADAVVVTTVTRVDGAQVAVMRLLFLDESQPRRGVAARLGDDLDAGLLALAQRLNNKDAGPPTPLPVPLALEPKDAVVTVDGRLQDRGEEASSMVWLMPGPHLLRVSAPGYESVQVVVEVKDDSLLAPRTISLTPGFPALSAVGVGVAAVGGVVLGAGAIGVGVAELVLAQPLDLGLRNTTQTAGRVFIGASVVGTVAVAGGAALAVFGFGE